MKPQKAHIFLLLAIYAQSVLFADAIRVVPVDPATRGRTPQSVKMSDQKKKINDAKKKLQQQARDLSLSDLNKEKVSSKEEEKSDPNAKNEKVEWELIEKGKTTYGEDPVSSPPPKKKTGGKIFVDENAKKGKGKTPAKEDPVNAMPGGEGTNIGGRIAFPYWYPMCLLIDESIGTAEGNAAVKGLVDQAAACNVNLVVFPVTVRNVPGDYATVNKMSQRLCNATQGLGVKQASTSVCVKSSTMADDMCGKKPTDPDYGSVGGCAQLAKANPHPDPKIQAIIERRTQGMTVSSGGMIPSIEDSGSCSAGIVGHEALGHSMWGHPNGSADGNGIGLPKSENEPDPPGNEGSGASGGWTGEGCSYMRAAAYKNDGRWTYGKDRQRYYKRQDDPNRQKDIMTSPPLWKNARGGMSQSDPEPPLVLGKPPKMAKDPVPKEEKIAEAEPETLEAKDTHKKAAPISDALEIAAMLGTPKSGNGARVKDRSPAAEESNLPEVDNNPVGSITMNESAKKPSQEGKTSSLDISDSSSSGNEDSSSLVMDESAPEPGDEADKDNVKSRRKKKKNGFAEVESAMVRLLSLKKSDEEDRLDKDFFTKKKKKEAQDSDEGRRKFRTVSSTDGAEKPNSRADIEISTGQTDNANSGGGVRMDESVKR